ncbi:sulfotransferase family protein [Glycomyces buryatensis]|uniref:sulfotransferase family protein n=1 Tax=Glycomyces buryatensis TaxID=2570927 RepID=UPI0014562B4D|nr:sulfotransferase [Glycomyces buryatensis]
MPNIPISTRLLNAFLGPGASGHQAPEQVFKQLLDKATETGGPADGDDAFLSDFRRLVAEMCSTSGWTALGWQSAVADLQLRLQNRLRIVRLHREVPELAAERVVAPIFVATLPRTATNFTRGVIGRSTHHRAPLLWEMTYTDLLLPERQRRERIKSVTQLYKQIGQLAPKYRKAVGLEAEEPDDCAHLLPHGPSHLMRADMPGYRKWLAKRDFRPDYIRLKQALQVLQHGRPPARWVLESPAHLDNLEAIREAFPDAKILWVHRDPITVLGSLCSLTEISQAMHLRGPDREAIGQNWMEMLAASIERARRARVALPREAIVDVPYPQLAADPRGALPLLYERLGSRWTQNDSGNLEKVLAGPGIARSHEQELSRYGLTSADVEAAFGDYPRIITGLWLR